MVCLIIDRGKLKFQVFSSLLQVSLEVVNLGMLHVRYRQ